jgi:hypothetical protein
MKKRKDVEVQANPLDPVPAVKAAAPVKKARKPSKCVVCGNDVAQFSSEDLCWVCRRLKISAWRDSDTQASVQE